MANTLRVIQAMQQDLTIDECYLDAFMDIQMNVESNSHISQLDYTRMEMEEIIEIVDEYADLVD